MNLREALKAGESYLAEKGVADAATDAWYLMAYSMKEEFGAALDKTWYLMHWEEPMLPAQYARYQSLLAVRGKRIPLQHITGEQEFMGFSFLVSDKVLIPRQDTETLVEEALKKLKPGMRVLDMCTGSGCIIVSLMKLLPGITGVASDVSKEALAVAQANAEKLGTCVDFRQGDLFEPVAGRFDLVISNPPYIPTKEIDRLMSEVRFYDPLRALDGGSDGLDFYRKLVTESREYLQPGGWLMVEIGCEQGTAVSHMMHSTDYQNIYTVKDLAGLCRVVAGQWP